MKQKVYHHHIGDPKSPVKEAGVWHPKHDLESVEETIRNDKGKVIKKGRIYFQHWKVFDKD